MEFNRRVRGATASEVWERFLLMYRAGGVLRWGLIALSLGVGCHRPQSRKTDEAAREPAPEKRAAVSPSPAGALPPGCVVAISLDPVALGPAIDALGGMIKAGAPRNGRIFGIDPKTDLRRITGCKMPARTSYVALLSGRIPTALVEDAVSDLKMGLRPETLAGIPIAGGATSWIARRGGLDAGEGELVLASDRDLLRATLAGPPTSYRLDPGAPFSAVVAGQELRKILAAKAGSEDTGLYRIKEVTVTLQPGAGVIAIRALVGDAAVSEKLGRSLKPLLSKVAAGLVGPGQTAPDVTATIDSGDLILRAELAAGSWAAVAARILPPPTVGAQSHSP